MSLNQPKPLFGSNYDNTDISSLSNEECQPIFNNTKPELLLNNNILPKHDFYNSSTCQNYVNGKEVSVESGVYSSAKQFCLSYTMKHTIGKGNFSIVKLATHNLTGQFVAIKIIDKKKLSLENLEKVHREIEVMKKLNHKNIVNLYQVFDSENIIYIIMEYVPHGELFEFINSNGPIKESKAKSIFLGILSAVEHCHMNNVVHRDLKAENLLLDSKMNIKLADFGFSTFNTCFSESHSTEKLLITWCGSPPYAAPEIFKGDPYAGTKADIWSMGVVLYVMVCGRLPFDGHSLAELKAQIISGNFQIPFWLTHECEHLIRRMLSKSPEKRPSLDEIRGHRWFNELKKSQSNEETLSSVKKSASNTSIKATMTSSAHHSLSHSSSSANSGAELGSTSQEAPFTLSPGPSSSEDVRSDFRDGHFNETALDVMEENGLTRSEVLDSLQTQSYDHLTAIYLLLCEKIKQLPNSVLEAKSNLIKNGKILSTLSLNNPSCLSQRPASYYKKSFTPVPDIKISNSSLNYNNATAMLSTNPQGDSKVYPRTTTLDPRVYRRRPLSQVTHKSPKTENVLRIYGETTGNPASPSTQLFGQTTKTSIANHINNNTSNNANKLQLGPGMKTMSNKRLILNNNNIDNNIQNGFYSLKTNPSASYHLPVSLNTNARLSPYENDKSSDNETVYKMTPTSLTIKDNNNVHFANSYQSQFHRQPSAKIPQLNSHDVNTTNGYQAKISGNIIMEPRRNKLKEIPQWIKTSAKVLTPQYKETEGRRTYRNNTVYSNNAVHTGPVIIVNAGGPVYNLTTNQG